MSVFKMNNSCGNKDPKSLVFAQLKIDIHRYLVSSRNMGNLKIVSKSFCLMVKTFMIAMGLFQTVLVGI